MSRYASLTIEQDPKCDTRFRITIPEQLVDRDAVLEGLSFRADYLCTIEGAEAWAGQVRYRVREVAAKQVRNSEALAWIEEHGGRVTTCRYATKHKGDQIRTIYLQKGQPLPSIINTHYRAGLSVSFKERDKAMLFKLKFMGGEQQLARAA